MNLTGNGSRENPVRAAIAKAEEPFRLHDIVALVGVHRSEADAVRQVMKRMVEAGELDMTSRHGAARGRALYRRTGHFRAEDPNPNPDLQQFAADHLQALALQWGARRASERGYYRRDGAPEAHGE